MARRWLCVVVALAVFTSRPVRADTAQQIATLKHLVEVLQSKLEETAKELNDLRAKYKDKEGEVTKMTDEDAKKAEEWQKTIDDTKADLKKTQDQIDDIVYSEVKQQDFTADVTRFSFVGPDTFRSQHEPNGNQRITALLVRTSGGWKDEIDGIGFDFSGNANHEPTVGGKIRTQLRPLTLDPGEHVRGFRAHVGPEGHGTLRMMLVITDGKHNLTKFGDEKGNKNHVFDIVAPDGEEVVGVYGTANKGDGIDQLGLLTRKIRSGR